jgi:hypothetical protein
MTESSITAHDALRDDILAGGHDDWVSMAEVRGCISRGRLADSASERQQLMLQTIRSLLQGGLVEVGHIPAPGDPGFLVWPGTLDEVMESLTERIIGRFAGRYDDQLQWQYTIWLNLTAKGQQASNAIVGKAPDS